MYECECVSGCVWVCLSMCVCVCAWVTELFDLFSNVWVAHQKVDNKSNLSTHTHTLTHTHFVTLTSHNFESLTLWYPATSITVRGTRKYLFLFLALNQTRSMGAITEARQDTDRYRGEHSHVSGGGGRGVHVKGDSVNILRKLPIFPVNVKLAPSRCHFEASQPGRQTLRPLELCKLTLFFLCVHVCVCLLAYLWYYVYAACGTAQVTAL